MIDSGDENSASVDPAKLRRFAIGIALVMLVYVAAGGAQADNDVTIETLKVHLTRPRFLLLVIPIVSVYATLRYWWYGISVPLTRNKIRKYLRHTRTLLVAKTSEQHYRQQIGQGNDEFRINHTELETKVPAGLTPYPFIIFTDSIRQPDENYMFHICRNRIDTYFPGIEAAEFSAEGNRDNTAWISPSKLRFITRLRAFIEDFDLWLPIALNGLGLSLFLPYIFRSG